MNDEKNVMSAYEVAELLNVSHTTVYDWVKKGLRGTFEKRIGRKRRMVFTEKDLLTFFEVESLDELLSRRME